MIYIFKFNILNFEIKFYICGFIFSVLKTWIPSVF